MVRVKVCGITRVEDALAASDAGADAIGLQFCRSSPRCVSPEQAKFIRDRLPPFMSVVGVFVNACREQIQNIAEICRLDSIQLHGNEPPDFVTGAKAWTIKAIGISGPDDLTGLERYQVDALLLDSKIGERFGGTGHCFNWSLLRGLRIRVPVILAGGLRADNVGDAIRATRPYAVDVCSGVESAPGVKDHYKMRALIENVRKTVF